MVWLSPLTYLIDALGVDRGKAAKVATELAKHEYKGNNVQLLLLSSLVNELEPKSYRDKWFAFSLIKNEFFSQALDILPAIESDVHFSKSEMRLYELAKENTLKHGLAATPICLPANPAQQKLLNKPVHMLKVACILDEFSFASFSPECVFKQLTPESWQNELIEAQPDLLFIESAWRGVEDKWGNKVGHLSSELRDILCWCNKKCIPTCFWNKEDPVHYSTFLSTAQLFDYVFTTDIDCIARYKEALGHDRVFILPFCCQPEIHNPVEDFSRKSAFAFAGAYYTRYPERMKDFDEFAQKLVAHCPLEIYDRNFGKDDPAYLFPEEFKKFIVGTLPVKDINKAYKGYKYAINLNSIKQSQTMFARRVYELLAPTQ